MLRKAWVIRIVGGLIRPSPCCGALNFLGGGGPKSSMPNNRDKWPAFKSIFGSTAGKCREPIVGGIFFIGQKIHPFSAK